MNWVEIAPIAGVLTGIGGLIGGLAAWRKSSGESQGSLSKAEAEFRRDLMARLDKAELDIKEAESEVKAAQTLAATASADANRCRADYQELLRAVETCSTPGCAIRTARLQLLSKGGG